MYDFVFFLYVFFDFLEESWFRKKPDGPELHGPELFQRNCQNVPGAAKAAADPAAASAVCISYVIIGGALRAPVEVRD